MTSFQCCYCGAQIDETKSERLCARLELAEGGTQELYAHAFCLRRHLHPSVPIILESETEIFIYLLNEGTDSWRPVRAVPLDSETFLLIPSQAVPDEEEWQFLPGQVVRCTPRQFSGGKVALAAVALIEERPNPSLNTDLRVAARPSAG